ncbi:MAG: type II toxin-antitoxin system RelE/ParE family toxin [Lachnospiraceae bacterium]|nr:type II toxin-antitoxin system RelE/ParE family toxin [Lachnospiraceae bacterium]
MSKRYRVTITNSAKEDVKAKKKYILRKFKYREYANSYSAMIKKAAKELDTLPAGYETTGFVYRGYDIYFRPVHGHLLFFIIDEYESTLIILRVLQDGMDWENIIRNWLRNQ